MHWDQHVKHLLVFVLFIDLAVEGIGLLRLEHCIGLFDIGLIKMRIVAVMEYLIVPESVSHI